jgi:hypothetical protein
VPGTDSAIDLEKFTRAIAALIECPRGALQLRLRPDRRSRQSIVRTAGIEWLFATDMLFNSGLRAGFANTYGLPDVWQVNLSAVKEFTLPRLGKVTDRVMLLNIFDRNNLIRPANGIGVFQSAYGPRITVYNALTVPVRRNLCRTKGKTRHIPPSQ